MPRTVKVNHCGDRKYRLLQQHRHKQRIGARRPHECDHPPPQFRFNSHRTRLDDPISDDIEPGTECNRPPGRTNRAHCSTLLRKANQIPSTRIRCHLFPFLREIISPASNLRDANRRVHYGVWLPETQNSQGWGSVTFPEGCSEHTLDTNKSAAFFFN